MSHPVLFHCPCTLAPDLSKPPPSTPPLCELEHHPLPALLFCEECDAIRCDNCATHEIACYFCPNCLFEVISASVRAEKNRCTRNCFQCPVCDHVLGVVNSEGDNSLPKASTSAAATATNPGQTQGGSFFLQCAVCRWDSKQVGISFEKPTGLALQLQQSEDASPALLEFDHLKDHLDPFLRRGQHQAGPSSFKATGPASAATAGAASLLKDLRGLGASARYGSLFGLAARARGGEGPGVLDELEKYDALFPASGGRGAGEVGLPRERRRGASTAGPVRQATGASGAQRVEDRDAAMVDRMRNLTDIDDIASLDQRWASSWKPSILASELRPQRTPLHAKRTKRCPACKHILIKPEQKPSSTRFKIKLVASSYLPAIHLRRRAPPTIGSRLSAIAAGAASGGLRRGARGAAGEAEDEPLRPGRTYTFELSFTNPLYEPIQVRLAVARPGAGAETAADEGQPPPPAPFAVQLQAAHFPISAFAEAWEYDDADEDEEDEEDGYDGGSGMGTPGSVFKKKRGGKGAGIVERKANRTTVAMDVAVGRDTVGTIRANMLVTYVYQDDDSVGSSPVKSPTKKGAPKEDVKTFSFWTLVTLGNVVPRPAAAAGGGEGGSRRAANVSGPA